MKRKIDYHHFETIDSTNTWGKTHALSLDREALTVITAETQTGGRGRFKRHWVSPPDQNIYVTYCFFLPLGTLGIGNIAQVLSISLCAVLKANHFDPVVKWPNDIVLNGKKVAGILCETTMVDQDLCVVLGIGVNVNMPLDAAKEIDRPATSLLIEGGSSYDRDLVLKALTAQFSKDLENYLKCGFGIFYPHFKELTAFYVGKRISFHDNLKVWEGLFCEVRQDGALLMQLEGETEKRVFIAGEILWNLNSLS